MKQSNWKQLAVVSAAVLALVAGTAYAKKDQPPGVDTPPGLADKDKGKDKDDDKDKGAMSRSLLNRAR